MTSGPLINPLNRLMRERIDMTNRITTAANFTTYSIHTDGGKILICDEAGQVIHSEPSDRKIDAATNSHLVAGHLNAHIPGWLVDVERDRDVIIVTTTEFAWNRPMNWRFRTWGESVVKCLRERHPNLTELCQQTDNELMAELWAGFADDVSVQSPEDGVSYLAERRYSVAE